MLRVTDDVLELRRWTEERGGWPCRSPDGRIALCLGGDPAPAIAIGWDEFEANFVLGRCAFVYDDSPGCTQCFVGGFDEARAWVASGAPRTTGEAGAAR